jgi:hypothetical protein
MGEQLAKLPVHVRDHLRRIDGFVFARLWRREDGGERCRHYEVIP